MPTESANYNSEADKAGMDYIKAKEEYEAHALDVRSAAKAHVVSAKKESLEVGIQTLKEQVDALQHRITARRNWIKKVLNPQNPGPNFVAPDVESHTLHIANLETEKALVEGRRQMLQKQLLGVGNTQPHSYEIIDRLEALASKELSTLQDKGVAYMQQVGHRDTDISIEDITKSLKKAKLEEDRARVVRPAEVVQEQPVIEAVVPSDIPQPVDTDPSEAAALGKKPTAKRTRKSKKQGEEEPQAAVA